MPCREVSCPCGNQSCTGSLGADWCVCLCTLIDTPLQIEEPVNPIYGWIAELLRGDKDRIYCQSCIPESWVQRRRSTSFSFKAKLPLINNFSRFLYFPLVKHQLLTRYKQSSRRDWKPQMSNPTSDFPCGLPSLTQTVWSGFPFESFSWWSLRKRLAKIFPALFLLKLQLGCCAATLSPSCPLGPDIIVLLEALRFTSSLDLLWLNWPPALRGCVTDH